MIENASPFLIMIKVCFVCLGNICRSPMAEYIFKYLIKEMNINKDIDCFSRATSFEEIGNDIYYPAKICLEKHHIPFQKREATRITKEELVTSDYVIVMENKNLSFLKYLFPQHDFKNVFLLNSFVNKNDPIKDPWYTGDFETTYDDLIKSIKGFIEKEIMNR